MLPDTVVARCDLVCDYLDMKPDFPRSISFITTNLGQKELHRRMARIIECLHLIENGGNYIGSTASDEAIEHGRLEYHNFKQ